MIKAIKGTKDILPGEINNWHRIENMIRSNMAAYNYKEIRTPIFEETRLFSRGIGEATDIVSKEMYTFTDRSEMSVTLRPEMTASVVRAFIEHNLDKINVLNKLFYIGAMFRQERPQAGRLRQFHQFGAEALGSNDPSVDAEMIILAYEIIKSTGLSKISVKINSLGLPESRENYKNVLREYLQDKFEGLSFESKQRYTTNILRLFDSKDENDQKIMKDAPLLINYLDQDSLDHFNKVKEILELTNIPYEVDPKLVRGLDYYTNTTFEIISGSVGSQSALCGGGRYNLLTEQLGGKATPGIGFAAGIERILLACENENIQLAREENLDVYLIRLDNNLVAQTNKLACYLRRAGLKVDLDYNLRSIKAQMREANKNNAAFTIFIGGDEFSRGNIQLKNMQSGVQEELSYNDTELLVSKISDK